jgi:hypothetical protein
MACWRISSALPLLCLIIVHRPDGTEMAIDTRQIGAIEVVQTRHQYAHGTKTLVHIIGEKIAVYEEPHEVEYLIKTCEDGAK